MQQSALEPRCYIDHHGVLDCGYPSMLDEMNSFVIAMDQLAVSMHVLSYRPAHDAWKTMQQFDDACIIDVFDSITFTSYRTAQEHSGSASLSIEHRYWQPRWSPEGATSEPIEYEVFDGGKEDYIRMLDNGATTFFVDDKWKTIEAVKQTMPNVIGIEFRRHRFHSPPTSCMHVTTLANLHSAIRNAIGIQMFANNTL